MKPWSARLDRAKNLLATVDDDLVLNVAKSALGDDNSATLDDLEKLVREVIDVLTPFPEPIDTVVDAVLGAVVGRVVDELEKVLSPEHRERIRAERRIRRANRIRVRIQRAAEQG